MEGNSNLNVFLNPRSVAVIGASERPGSWGSFMMEGLFSWHYPGTIYPVNLHADEVYGIPTVGTVSAIEGPVDLAICAVPERTIEEVIEECGKKGIKGMSIITAGFGEAVDEGRMRERALAELANSYGMRLLGPNISGTFNLHARFNAAASPAEHLFPTELAAVCQGGYAFYDLLASASSRGMGVGKFIHTGNECDLTVTDFLEFFGDDENVKGILMYLETIRDSARFFEVARRVTKKKPVVAYKAGRTPGSARAARSHTGALSGRKEIYEGFFHQAGIVLSPSMEILVPLGHALIERPPMTGNRVAIVTVGGSWGVALSDALEECDLTVPELSEGLQSRLRELGMPVRASTKNPVDIGAAGFLFSIDTMVDIGREVIRSGEVDALILHGFGRPGLHSDETPGTMKLYGEVEKEVMTRYASLEKEIGRPVLIGSHFSPWESQAVCDINREGLRVFNHVGDTALLLSSLSDYWKGKREKTGTEAQSKSERKLLSSKVPE